LSQFVNHAIYSAIIARVVGIDAMPKCVKCGTETGFIGSLTFNKQTGRCGNCESEVMQSLMRFRTAFLNFYSDGIFTDEKWSRLLAGAANELCHLEMSATFHKINARSSSLLPGRIVVTNKKLRFLSLTGGTEIWWNSVMRVQVQSGGIYLELSRKTGNGFYSVSDPLLLEAIIDTLVRMTKRQLVGLNSDNSSRHIPQDVRYAVWQRD